MWILGVEGAGDGEGGLVSGVRYAMTGDGGRVAAGSSQIPYHLKKSQGPQGKLLQHNFLLDVDDEIFVKFSPRFAPRSVGTHFLAYARNKGSFHVGRALMVSVSRSRSCLGVGRSKLRARHWLVLVQKMFPSSISSRFPFCEMA